MFHEQGSIGGRRGWKRPSRRTLAIVTAVVLIAGTGIASAVSTPPVTGLLYSADASHASPKRIAHAAVPGSIDLFIGGATGSIASVEYFVDEATGTSTPLLHTTTAPFDFPFDASKLTTGVTHNVLAVLTTTGGTEADLFARFTVAAGATPTAPVTPITGPTVTVPTTTATTAPCSTSATVPPTSSGTTATTADPNGDTTDETDPPDATTDETDPPDDPNADNLRKHVASHDCVLPDSGGTQVDQPPITGTTPATPSADDGTSAAAKFNWGTPVKVHNFDAMDGWSAYNGGPDGTIDFGLKFASDVTFANGVVTLNGTSDGHTAGMEDDSPEGSKMYGRWETRMKTTGDKTCWRPVMLLWPDNGGDSDVGEFDYAESGDGKLDAVGFNLHFGRGDEQTGTDTPVDQTQWHDYAVEWNANSVTGYVDGVQFFSETDPNNIPKANFHATLQLDSDDGGGLCNDNKQMQVDWMKIYNP